MAIISSESFNIRRDINVIENTRDEFMYELKCDLVYYSKRYNKTVTAKKGSIFDGATGAKDINSASWVIHDVLCWYGMFDDGSKCTNLQASAVLHDILKEEGRWFRRYTWFVATWLFGGGEARKNGMI